MLLQTVRTIGAVPAGLAHLDALLQCSICLMQTPINTLVEIIRDVLITTAQNRVQLSLRPQPAAPAHQHSWLVKHLHGRLKVTELAQNGAKALRIGDGISVYGINLLL